jgi:hypothetical protein
VLDVADDVFDEGVDDLSLPHAVTATPTSRVLATNADAIVDIFSKIGSFALWSHSAAYRNIAGTMN